MKDYYEVNEVEGEPDKNIVIRGRGNSICFNAMNGSFSLYIDETTADSIAFHISTIIQDRERRKNKQNNAGQI